MGESCHKLADSGPNSAKFGQVQSTRPSLGQVKLRPAGIEPNLVEVSSNAAEFLPLPAKVGRNPTQTGRHHPGPIWPSLVIEFGPILARVGRCSPKLDRSRPNFGPDSKMCRFRRTRACIWRQSACLARVRAGSGTTSGQRGASSVHVYHRFPSIIVLIRGGLDQAWCVRPHLERAGSRQGWHQLNLGTRATNANFQPRSRPHPSDGGSTMEPPCD